MTFEFDASGQLKKISAEELEAMDSDSAVLVLDRGVLEGGEPYWAYIVVKPSKYADFMHANTSKGRILSDYGTILKYGFEPEVPENIKEEMRQKYNFDENYTEQLEKKVLAQQTVFLENQESKRLGDIVAMLKKKQAES